MSTCERKCPGSVLKKMMVGLIMVDDGGVSDANDGVSLKIVYMCLIISFHS